MNLPVMEDLWTVLAPLPLAMSILPAGNDSGFPSAGQRATRQRYGPERPYASPMHVVMSPSWAARRRLRSSPVRGLGVTPSRCPSGDQALLTSCNPVLADLPRGASLARIH